MTADLARLRERLLFQGNPLDLADPARVAAFTAPFQPDPIRNCPAAWLRLGRTAVQAWDVPPATVDFNSPLAPLLLLDLDQLRRAAAWLALLAYYPQIQRTLRGTILARLKALFPFAYPALLREAPAFKTWLPLLAATATSTLDPDNLQPHGLAILLAALDTFPPETVRRWRLRFPSPEIDALSPATPWNASPQQTADLLAQLSRRNLLITA